MQAGTWPAEPDPEQFVRDGCPEWRPGAQPRMVAERFPHLRGMRALRCESDFDAGEWLRRPLTLVVISGRRFAAATALQIAPVLDHLYADEARRRSFGPRFTDDGIELAVWAPTAQRVRLQLWPDADAAGQATQTLAMTRQSDGTYTTTLPLHWRDAGYLFKVSTPRPGSDNLAHDLVTDPYSTGLTVNSTRSVLTDLRDPRWAPAGFADSTGPRLAQLSDAAVYELHVRDFSWADPLVHPGHRGTFVAFADDGLGSRHLRSLAEAGLNTVHLLPCFDVASINENRAEQLVPEGIWDADPASPEPQREITTIGRSDAYNWGYDPFHWGAPEGSYTTSTDTALGGGRTREFRTMVQAIHDLGLRVVLDQVFTHTSGSGRSVDSVLDRVVPGYYHRLDADGRIFNSTAVNNVATENAMAEQIMVDMVVRWARDYRVDGFRFDLMGHSSAANMLAVRRALDALTIETDGVDGRQVYLYGEGWNFGEVADNARFVQATQGQVHESRIATFSDRLRDAVRGGHPMDADPRGQGFGSGLGDHPGADLQRATDLVQLGLAGNLRDYRFTSASGQSVSGRTLDYQGQAAGYADQPWDVMSYVDAHDNETLWDALTMKLPGTSMTDRVRMNTLSLACATLAQTPVLWHAGTDLLRSKSLDRNSYESGDWFNRLDWLGDDNGFGRGLPPEADNRVRWDFIAPLLADPALKPRREQVLFAAGCAADLLRLRYSSPLFRLDDAALIEQKLSFPVSGTREQVDGVIVMLIDDRLGEPVDPARAGVLVVFNATGDDVVQQVPALRGRLAALSAVQADGVDPVVRRSSWDADRAGFGVPARTVAVFDLLT